MAWRTYTWPNELTLTELRAQGTDDPNKREIETFALEDATNAFLLEELANLATLLPRLLTSGSLLQPPPAPCHAISSLARRSKRVCTWSCLRASHTHGLLQSARATSGSPSLSALLSLPCLLWRISRIIPRSLVSS